jgi:hypothetical protein
MQAMFKTDDTSFYAPSSWIMNLIWKGRQFENSMMVSHRIDAIHWIEQKLSEDLIASKRKSVSDEKRNRARFFIEQRIQFCNAIQITERMTCGKWSWSSPPVSLKALINGHPRWGGSLQWEETASPPASHFLTRGLSAIGADLSTTSSSAFGGTSLTSGEGSSTWRLSAGWTAFESDGFPLTIV